MAHRNPYVHRSCIASTCATCDGTGRVASSDGLDVRCETCSGYGETYRSEFSTEAAASPVTSGKAVA